MDEDLPFCQSTLLHYSSVRMEKLCWLQLEMEENLLFPVEGGARCPGGGDATVEGRGSLGRGIQVPQPTCYWKCQLGNGTGNGTRGMGTVCDQ